MAMIDLTGLIHENMWTFGPPLPEVQLPRMATLEHEGWDAHLMHMGNIQGTSLETAAHLLPNQPTIDTVPIERFFVRAAVLQVPDKGRREEITVADLEKTGIAIKPGMAILVGTAWHNYWDDDRYYWDSPHLTKDSMQWLVDKKPSILGLDIPSADDPYNPLWLNKILFSTGALLLAPLVNINQISKSYVNLVALPLRIQGLCGTPCRAIAIEDLT